MLKKTKNDNVGKPKPQNLFKVALRNFIRSSIAEKLLALLGFVASIVIPLFFSDKQPYLYTILILLGVLLLYFAYIYSKVHNFKLINTIIIFSICFVIIGGLKYGLDYFKYKSNPCGYPETLYEYFNCGDLKAGQYRIRGVDFVYFSNLKNNESIKVKYESHLNLNFENMTYNIEFYCHNEVLMLWFGEIVPSLVDSLINKNLLQENAIPNIMRDKATSLKDLTFTKIVYLYLDTFISAQQEQLIKARFEKHEPPLKLILRTRLYPFHKNNGVQVTPE